MKKEKGEQLQKEGASRQEGGEGWRKMKYKQTDWKKRKYCTHIQNEGESREEKRRVIKGECQQIWVDTVDTDFLVLHSPSPFFP